MIKVKHKPCNGVSCNGKLQPIWKNEMTEEGRKSYCKACWAQKSQAGKPTKPRQNLKRSSTPVKKVSDKKKARDIVYKVLREQYLKNHPMCEMAIKGICTKAGTTIQHLRGRCGEYYTDDRYFMSACLPCHQFVDTHPDFALENGFAELRLKNYENE